MALRGLDLLAKATSSVFDMRLAKENADYQQRLQAAQISQQQRREERMVDQKRVFDASQQAKRLRNQSNIARQREDAADRREIYRQGELTKRKKIPSTSHSYYHNDGKRGGGRDYSVTDATKIYDDMYQSRIDYIEKSIEAERKKMFGVNQGLIARLEATRDELITQGAEYYQKNVGNVVNLNLPKKKQSVPFYLERPKEDEYGGYQVP